MRFCFFGAPEPELCPSLGLSQNLGKWDVGADAEEIVLAQAGARGTGRGDTTEQPGHGAW